MRCFKCGCVLTDAPYCANCGEDVTIYQRIIYLSNIHYNEGLKRAEIRDLSGAVTSLSKSLKYNKRNLEARNLLGLVYYEMGYLAEALTEWIISVNISPAENLASVYMKEVENDREQLDSMNQTKRKSNQCLQYMEAGSDDLAFIQLKKLIAEKPKLVDAYQLMGLLLIRRRQYASARQCLQRALSIDRGNLRAIYYNTELRQMNDFAGRSQAEERPEPETKVRREKNSVEYTRGNDTIIQPAGKAYHEGFTMPSALNVVIGALIGAAIVWFLFVPAKIQAVRQETNDKILSFSDDLASKDAEIEDLNKQLQSVQTDVTTAQQQSDTAAAAISGYESLLSLQQEYSAGNSNALTVAKGLTSINRDALSTKGQEIYDTLKQETYATAAASLYSTGKKAFNNEDYATAVTNLEQAYAMDPTYGSGDLIYYLAASYEKAGNTDKAKTMYQQLIDQYPNNSKVTTAKTALSKL